MSNGHRRDGERGCEGGDGKARVDFTIVLIIIVVIAVVLLLTFELWLPHEFPH